MIYGILDFDAKSDTWRGRLLFALDRLFRRINTRLGPIETIAYSLFVASNQDEDRAIESEIPKVLRKLYKDVSRHWCIVAKESGGRLMVDCYVVRCRPPRAVYIVKLRYTRLDIAYVPRKVEVVPVVPVDGFGRPCRTESAIKVIKY